MQAGTNLKKYRNALKFSQRHFADKLGVSQATLSLIESGKIALSESLEKRLRAEFNKEEYEPSFDAHCKMLETGRRDAQTLVGNPDANFATLPVWRWEDGFDLGAPPNTVKGQGLVTVRTSSDEAIAFEMPQGSRFWVAGEILVFLRSALDRCGSGDLCLIQMRSLGTQTRKTMIVSLRFDETSRHRTVQFETAGTSGTVFEPNVEEIEGLLRCIFRGRYL